MESFSDPTIISMKCYGRTITVELDHSDVNLSEILESLYAMLIGHTWLPSVVLSGMRDFVETHEAYTDNRSGNQ